MYINSLYRGWRKLQLHPHHIIAKYRGGIVMIEVGLGIVLLIALVGGIAYSGVEHKRISGKWLVGLVALGLIGLAMSKGLPIELGEFKGLV